ncbi:MAG: long-chain-fatty-acid--CoA ligase [Desulfobacteraceae bacterium]|nr:long-chain-fatty-acid--CoA ligase [Desulfobacteraceae bacterium]
MTLSADDRVFADHELPFIQLLPERSNLRDVKVWVSEGSLLTKKYLLQELCRYPLGTFANIVYRNAILFPDHEAFVCGSERISFKQFNARANRLIHGLHALGIQKGDIIGILSWNRLEYLEVFGAAMKGGFVLAHYNPRQQAGELVHLINDSEPRILFIGPECVETIDKIHNQLPKTILILVLGDGQGYWKAYGEIVEGQSRTEPESKITEEDPLTIFYTSGTTGRPRGSIYKHKQKLENATMKALHIGVEFGDRHLAVLPLFHIGGDSHIWPFFLMGGCNVIIPRHTFDPAEALQMIAEEQISDFHIVPTQLISLLNLPDIDQYDIHNLKRIWYAASPMPTEVLKKGLSVFGPIFFHSYGQTESGPEITVLSKSNLCYSMESIEAKSVIASCGQPCIDVHVRIVDEAGCDVEEGKIGEIIVKSKRIMTEYWRKPEETKETIQGGWLFTGDMGYYDENGYIYIADRKKDMIITGGENVYPIEVENVLYRYPAIKEVAVIGIPDPYWVERVHALVVLKENVQATSEDIITFCRDNISHYKAPRSVEFVKDLPKNPQGKILKKEIRSKYWKT